MSTTFTDYAVGWGVASAAFQVEGAVRDEGRGPSNWDRLTRVPGYISDNSTADIGDNNYYLYKQGSLILTVWI